MRALAVAVVVIGVAARAHAQPVTAPEPIDLRYGAAEGCPDAGAFFAAVRARAKAVLAMRAEATFEVRIVADGDGFRGSLNVRAGGEIATREVSGTSCTEVANALALVAALAIEQRRAQESARGPQVAPVSPVVPVAPVAPAGRWHVGAGAGIAELARITPDPLWGVGVFATVASGRSGPRIRAGFARTLETDVQMAAGSSAFRTTTGRAEVCPHVFVLGIAELSGCVAVEAGVVAARGSTVDMPASEQRPWVAPQGVLRAGIRIGRVSVEIDGALAVPLVRDRFLFEPSTTVHEVPAVTTAVGTSVAVEIF